MHKNIHNGLTWSTRNSSREATVIINLLKSTVNNKNNDAWSYIKTPALPQAPFLCRFICRHPFLRMLQPVRAVMGGPLKYYDTANLPPPCSSEGIEKPPDILPADAPNDLPGIWLRQLLPVSRSHPTIDSPRPRVGSNDSNITTTPLYDTLTLRGRSRCCPILAARVSPICDGSSALPAISLALLESAKKTPTVWRWDERGTLGDTSDTEPASWGMLPCLSPTLRVFSFEVH